MVVAEADLLYRERVHHQLKVAALLRGRLQDGAPRTVFITSRIWSVSSTDSISDISSS